MLVNFILKMYHDARSPERQICISSIFLVSNVCIYIYKPIYSLVNARVHWLRCCVTNREIAGLIPASVSGIFIDIKSFRSQN